MAANQTVEIVISAKDRFSPAFLKLDQALAAGARSGGGMKTALEGLDGALEGVAASAGNAQRATAEFAERSRANLTGYGEFQQEFQEEQAVLGEEAALAYGERLIEIDEETQARRTEAAESAQQHRLQSIQAHQSKLEAIGRDSGQRMAGFEQAQFEARLAFTQNFMERLSRLAATQGGSMARTAKALAIAAALIDTYRGAAYALGYVPFPLNFPAAALVTAEGLANVQRIKQTSVAHGGLTEVPEDSTFLLRRGERVLSPNQNRELTEFLDRSREEPRAGGGIEHVEIHILENATASSALLSMDSTEWREVINEKIIPALDELADQGIRPAFADETA